MERRDNDENGAGREGIWLLGPSTFVLEGSLSESLSDGDAGGLRFPCWGRRVFPSSIVIQGSCDSGTTGVAPFLKALHLDCRHGFDVSYDVCAFWRLVDEWRRILQREVKATASGTWLGNDDMR
jgi:hypothetical protein